MKLYEICFSPTGGTECVTGILAEALEIEFLKKKVSDCIARKRINLLEKDFGFHEFLKDDFCIISVPSYGGRVPYPAVKRLSKLEGNRAKAILVCVYGNRAFEDTLVELQDVLEHQGFVCTSAVAAIAEHSIFRQFASARPDHEDAEELRKFASQIASHVKKTFDSGDCFALSLPGNHPYRTFDGVPLKPYAGKSCKDCGICALDCPTGAISKDNPKDCNKELCISCMRCVRVCPEGARKVNPLMLKIAGKKMKKVCSERKENQLFL